MDRAFTAYVRIAGGVLLLLGAVAALNVVTDPFLVFSRVSLRALTPYRGVGSRIYKAELLRGADVETLMLGTSQVAIGIDPESSAWDYDHVFDFSRSVANLWEIERSLDFALAESRPRRVMLLLNVGMFNPLRTSMGDFERSPLNPDLSADGYLMDNLVQLQATKESARVLARAMSGTRGPLTRRGDHNIWGGTATSQVAKHEGRFERSLKCIFLVPERLVAMSYPNDRIDTLKRIVRTCVDRDVEIVVAILPKHALHLEAVYMLGLWESFHRWKRDLVDVANVASIADVWDFAYYHGLTTETVPRNGKADVRMKWWIDTNHFRPDLGEVIVRRIGGRYTSDEPSGFGVRVSKNNLEAHIAQMQHDRDAYIASHREEVEWIRRLYQRTLPARRYNAAP